MKKTALVLVFLFAMLPFGCQGKSQKNAPVFEPHELLTAAEASELSGFATRMDEGSLTKDPDSGTISERYVYDIGQSTIHALVQIEQNGYKSSDALKQGDTAEKSFSFEKTLSKNNLTAVDVGEQAFTINGTGQLHMLYKDYYIVVAFDQDDIDTDQNDELNVKIGKKILANLQNKLK